MSELREECYKCKYNNECLGGAEYGSLYCSLNRKYDLSNIDYSYGKDQTVKTITIDSIVLENRIKNLERKIEMRLYEDYKERYKIIGAITAYKNILNL